MDDMKKIQTILMDVDGVLTDGRILLGSGNVEMKAFHVHDGLAIAIAQKNGFKIGLITSRKSDIVEKRAEELGVVWVHQGVKDKLERMEKISEQEKIDLEKVCYVGDDLIDIPAMKAAGFSATVADAPDEVKACASFVSSKKGGRGAVREIIEKILKSQDKWQY
jgi:3-deoxy-D-manno-octulosonate 8-phosphate phosphatase (KDO 8-P phosphatase)